MIVCPRTGHWCQMCQLGCQYQGLPQPTYGNMGWQCPKCGRGNAPFVQQCPCGPSYTVTASGNANWQGSTEPTCACGHARAYGGCSKKECVFRDDYIRSIREEIRLGVRTEWPAGLEDVPQTAASRSPESQ